jgi:putative membrane protein
MIQLSKFQVSLGVILIMHTVGLVGMIVARDWFIPLTPINLIVSGYFVLRHADSPKALLYATIALLAFAIEAIGVATGWPFGDYFYGRALGPHVFRVPLLIGLLWLLLLQGAQYWTHRWFKSTPLQLLIPAAMMAGIDFLIEPIAIDFEYWQWINGTVPWNNYAGWFGTALILTALSHIFDKQFANNRVAGLFFIVQVVFFLALNLLLV